MWIVKYIDTAKRDSQGKCQVSTAAQTQTKREALAFLNPANRIAVYRDNRTYLVHVS